MRQNITLTAARRQLASRPRQRRLGVTGMLVG